MNRSICALAAMLFTAASAQAATIVQTGTLSGGAQPQTQTVNLNQFDTMGGTRQLNFVKIDFLTSLIGGYQTTGSGVPVDILAQLDAEWSFNGNLIADTQALVEATVANTSVGAFTVFNTDTEQVIYNQPIDLAAWIGSGQTQLSAFTQFIVTETPAGIINFDAGGTIKYTVTFDYTNVPAPPAAAGLAIMGLLTLRNRRRR